jgi:hypothetical protein
MNLELSEDQQAILKQLKMLDQEPIYKGYHEINSNKLIEDED